MKSKPKTARAQTRNLFISSVPSKTKITHFLLSPTKKAISNIFYMGMISFAVAGKAGLGSIPMLPFLAACVIAVTVLTLLVCVVSIAVAFVAWRRGLDPDNVTIPISTSISDVLAVFSLLAAIRMVGFI